MPLAALSGRARLRDEGVTHAVAVGFRHRPLSPLPPCRPELLEVVRASKKALDASRPTAVNLMWATARIQETAEAIAALPSVTVAAFKGA